MKTLLTFLLFTAVTLAQNPVTGTVLDSRDRPVEGANVYLDGTYDGATTATDGTFTFNTDRNGTFTLTVSFLGYDTRQLPVELPLKAPVTVRMRESVNTLDAVVINAGSLEAGDKARNSVLKPLDIVTTAGSAGNIIAALQTLPGTQSVGEDGRLFVRGGEADETQTFVDGIRVAQPYNATTNNLPTRGRFSPFLFSGIAFSTGGYSAEYGEALSSVLLLNTQDEPDQEKTDLAFMTVGLGAGHTAKGEKQSVSVNLAYIDLAPYQAMIPQNVHWERPYHSGSGEAVYRRRFNNGLFKFYAAFDLTNFSLDQDSINSTQKTRVDLTNNNLYLNASYKTSVGQNWQLFGGAAYGSGKNRIHLNQDLVNNQEDAFHFKFRVMKKFSDRFKLTTGADYFLTYFDETYRFGTSGTQLGLDFKSGIAAAYAETDLFFSKNFALKTGIRASYNDLLETGSFNPRVALAYKLRKAGQFSLAYGEFTQAPQQAYLKYSRFHQFENERATHFILNYQYTRDKQTLRTEFYLKKYRDLVRYDGDRPQFNSVYSNDGDGYAKGIDVFWRDGRSIRNLEYWVSYSYIDSKRLYRNFPVEATPSFVSDHNISVVTKYWIEDWRSQLSITNSTASGRPYHNPNLPGYMNGRTKAYNNLSIGYAYLLSQQKILYFSASNVLGTPNVFGYQYASTPDANGIYQGREITQAADRFFFIGFFWTISADKSSNQLKNL